MIGNTVKLGFKGSPKRNRQNCLRQVTPQYKLICCVIMFRVKHVLVSLVGSLPNDLITQNSLTEIKFDCTLKKNLVSFFNY